jgi:hypothetical protein
MLIPRLENSKSMFENHSANVSQLATGEAAISRDAERIQPGLAPVVAFAYVDVRRRGD